MVNNDEPKRRYPGEVESEPLLSFLNGPASRSREPVAKLVSDLQRSPARRGDTTNEVNSVLRRYRVAPLAWSAGANWQVGWRPLPGPDEGEANAVLALLKLVERGVIDRVQKCGRCGKWYFARFEHQKFCSNACKTAAFRETDEFRNEWRLYMSKYRERKAKEAKEQEKSAPRPKRGRHKKK